MQRKLEQTMRPASPGRAMGPETARPDSREIATLAHELWIARGCPEGSPETDWFQAEEQLHRGEDQAVMAA